MRSTLGKEGWARSERSPIRGRGGVPGGPREGLGRRGSGPRVGTSPTRETRQRPRSSPAASRALRRGASDAATGAPSARGRRGSGRRGGRGAGGGRARGPGRPCDTPSLFTPLLPGLWDLDPFPVRAGPSVSMGSPPERGGGSSRSRDGSPPECVDVVVTP